MRRLAVVLVLLGLLAAAPGALASATTETGIADDAVFQTTPATPQPATAIATVSRWRSLGIGVARVFARWAAIAPKPSSTHAPSGFKASDPEAPGYGWGPLDLAVRTLTAAGIRPMVSITGSGPLWASKAPGRHNPRYRPDPVKFGAFAAAVATRYKGRVHRYLIWNEPNLPGWLEPQFTCVRHHGCTPASPDIYRSLFRAAATAIRHVDPTAQVLAGTTSPKGDSPTQVNATMRPLLFLRTLGCVNARYVRVRTGACRTATPLRADSIAYHPHSVLRSPSQHDPNPDDANLADLGRLETALDRISVHGLLKPAHGARFTLTIDEYGYQTSPPDPYSGVTPAQQADWLQQADYIAYRDPRVRTLTQYEWKDDHIFATGTARGRYAGWQSGLLYASGKAKPSLAVFPIPFWVQQTRGRAKAVFFGQVRPAFGTPAVVKLQTRSGAGAAWTTVDALKTNPLGYWTRIRTITRRAQWRYIADFGSDTLYTPMGLTSAVRVVAPSR